MILLQFFSDCFEKAIDKYQNTRRINPILKLVFHGNGNQDEIKLTIASVLRACKYTY